MRSRVVRNSCPRLTDLPVLLSVAWPLLDIRALYTFRLIKSGLVIIRFSECQKTDHCYRDNGWLKCLVSLTAASTSYRLPESFAKVFYLFIVETINSGLIIGLVYEPLILKYGGSTLSFSQIKSIVIVTAFHFLGQSEAMTFFPLRKSITSLSRVG